MPAREGHDLALVEDRLPAMQVGRVRRQEAAIGIVGEGDIAGPVAALDQRDGAAVIDARIPGGAEIHRHRDSQPGRVGQHHREVLRLLDEGRMRGAVERIGHVLGRGAAMIGENLQRDFVDRQVGGFVGGQVGDLVGHVTPPR